MTYVKFRNDEGEEYGSCEVFYLVGGEMTNEAGETLGVGWYWWTCFPGCLPDGDPMGPFVSEKEAIADARGED